MKKNELNVEEKSKINYKFIAGFVVIALLSVGGLLATQQGSSKADIVVYKSPTCGCCKDWITHLEENGFQVEVHDQNDVAAVKKELGVPLRLQSCHTATVDGYLIEGHVPADLISKMRSEKPMIKGLAVPGMPMGAPGMEGPRKDDYDIVAFDDQGKTSIYASR